MNRFQRWLGYARGLWLSWRYGERPAWVCQLGKITANQADGGLIRFGQKVWLWPEVKLDVCSTDLRLPARLLLGNNVSVGDRTQIHAGERVEIGEDTLISWDCVIMDRDYHDPDGVKEVTAPVHIGRHVWIGCRVIILKGVTIGDNAVIGAGSVVTRDVPAGMLAAGNPARVIRPVEGYSGAMTATD